MILLCVERPRPVSKGLKLSVRYEIHLILCRKTPPCLKGIETYHLPCNQQTCGVERPRPVSKGLKQGLGCRLLLGLLVERPRPVSKGLKQC